MMKIIISPAKTMRPTSDDFTPITKPIFLEHTKILHQHLKKMDEAMLKPLLKCNDDLVSLNYQRYQNMSVDEAVDCALMSYDGIQYKNIGAHLMSEDELDYLQKNLRILSGFYGVLCPMDKIVAYRLEMQTKIKIEEHANLYCFWKQPINEYFKDEMIVNLASKEYSDVLCDCKEAMLTIDFKVKVKDKLVIKATLAKMARGAMVRYMAQNKIKEIDEIKGFSDFDFKFNEEISTKNHWIFVKE